MEEDNKYTLNDLVKLSASQQPLEFQQVFDTLILDKIQAAVDNKKLEIAQSMFNSAPEE
jgi:late competence protein required for DNA uptake (superfamily II DNA/RNA helicase)